MAIVETQSVVCISEDIIISKQIINCIAKAHGIEENIPLNLLENEKFYRSD